MRKFAVVLLLLLVAFVAGCRTMKALETDIKHGSEATQDKVEDIVE